MFNNQEWRKLLTEVCQKVDCNKKGLQVISPFGFEVTNDKKYLSRHLRKFYAYLSIPPAIMDQKDAITESFAEQLLSALKLKNREFFDDLVILIKNNELKKFRPEGYICHADDKLLDIQVRFTDEGILTDYADSLIANLNGFLLRKGQCSAFYENIVNRCRTTQLYVIFENLFSEFIPPLNAEEKTLYILTYKHIDNMISSFFNPSIMEFPPTSREIEIYEGLMTNRVKLIVETISQGPNLKKISCIDYHIPAELEIFINDNIYQTVLKKIMTTYRDFV